MFPPSINYARVHQATEAAEKMLEAYKKNQLDLNKNIKRLQEEILAATAIVHLITRADARREVLGDCHPYSDMYADVIGDQVGLAQHQQFLSTLEFRKTRYTELLDTTNKAIGMLENDIADLKKIAKTRFGGRLAYFSIPSNGWSLFPFRHAKTFPEKRGQG